MKEAGGLKKRGFFVIFALILSVSLGLGPAEEAHAADNGYKSSTEASSALSSVRSYVLQLLEKYPADAPYYGTSSEWMLLSLARDKTQQEEPVYAQYYSEAVDFIKNNGGKVSSGGGREKPTDYERIILALTAMGYDARDIGGYNLFTYLSTQSNVTWQGINSVIFGLLAVNSSSDYDFLPASESGAAVGDATTKQSLINYLVSQQKEDGGWNLFGSKSDVDLTGMALQALAPFRGSSIYDADSKVSNSINRALVALEGMQASDGGFGSALAGAGSNSNSQAQVVTALAALGINDTDPRFVKQGNTAISNMLSYHIEGSGFKYLATQSAANGMATEQCYYALVAYDRAAKGENSLYNMDDSRLGNAAGKGGTTPGDSNEENGSGTANGSGTSNSSHGDSSLDGNNGGQESASSSASANPSVKSFSSFVMASKNASQQASKSKSTASDKASDDSSSDSEGWNFSADEYKTNAESKVSNPASVSTENAVSVPVVITIAALSALAGGLVTGGMVLVSKKAGTRK